ncbi:hypothetical protein DMUE_4332 [Dictyocoela muelleri]|nr:hypothetical protein DMUE_4332 [Dictyocoela muelleri]
MMNYKAKTHIGRSPINKNDALCIMEFDTEIKSVFACTIDNKEQFTIVPIICSQVESNSIIWTCDHGGYCNLKDLFRDHGTVIHKYNFIGSSIVRFPSQR